MFAFFNLNPIELVVARVILLVFIGVGVALLFMFFGKSKDKRDD
jgi:hypothetical protein